MLRVLIFFLTGSAVAALSN